jgi:hypothetical protein
MGTVHDCGAERKNYGTLFNREKGQAIRLGCNRWSCKSCGPRKARRTQKRLRPVPWKKFITVTMPPGRGWAVPANLHYQATHLRSFWRALRRQFGHFRYAWVREIGAPRDDCRCLDIARRRRPDVDNDKAKPDAGEQRPLLDCICGAGGSRLHLHVVVDIERWVDRDWLNATARRCGLGFVDIRAIRGSLVEYVTKYLAKGWAAPFPRGARRVQMAGVAPVEPEPGWAFSPCELGWAITIHFGGLAIANVDAIRFYSLDTG